MSEDKKEGIIAFIKETFSVVGLIAAGVFFFSMLQNNIHMNEYRITQNESSIAELKRITDGLDSNLDDIKQTLAVITRDLEIIKTHVERDEEGHFTQEK